jgi:hypothetical protein
MDAFSYLAASRKIAVDHAYLDEVNKSQLVCLYGFRLPMIPIEDFPLYIYHTAEIKVKPI